MLRSECSSRSPGGLICQVWDGAWASASPQVPWWCCCCWSGHWTSRTTNRGKQLKQCLTLKYCIFYCFSLFYVCAKLLSHLQLFATQQNVARQAPLSMRFSRQEEWNGLPCPSPQDLPDSGIEPASPVSPALAGRFFTTEPPGSPINCYTYIHYYVERNFKY